MKPAEATEIVSTLLLAFDKATWSEQFMRLFADNILDIDVGVGKRAAWQLVQSCTFPPTIAEFRKAAVQQIHGGKRPALDAWADVTHAIRRIGALYGDGDKAPCFDDPITARVVDRMGWNHLCTTDTPDGVIEKRFCDFYESIQDNEATMRQLSESNRPMLNVASTKQGEFAAVVAGIGNGGVK